MTPASEDDQLMPVPQDDPEFIQNAVDHINDLASNAILKGAIDIGDYVLATFFDDDITLASSKNPHKPNSYSRLCRHPDLLLSPTTLNRMVRVAAQERFLKDAGINSDLLNYRHKTALTALENNDQKIALARECIQQPMTSRELEDRVRQILNSLTEPYPHEIETLRYIRRISRWSKTADAPGAVSDYDALTRLSQKDRTALYQKTAAFLEWMNSLSSALNGMMEQLSFLLEEGDGDPDNSGGGEAEADGEEF